MQSKKHSVTVVGAGVSFLIGASALAQDAGDLWVVGFSSSNAVLFDGVTGAPTGIVASGGGLSGAHSVTVGPDANLYVTSFNNGRVIRFDGQTGAFIDRFVWNDPAVPGNETGGLVSPADVVFDGGFMYVASLGNDRVLRYNGATGAFIDVFVWDDPATGAIDESGGLDETEFLNFAPNGMLYIASGGTDEVLRFDGSTGAFIDKLVFDDPGTVPDESAGLNNPHGFAFGPGGDLFISSFLTNQVLRFDGTTGLPVSAFVPVSAGAVRPHDTAFDADGNLYVASFNSNDVRKFAPDGTPLGVFASGAGLNLASGMAFVPPAPCPADLAEPFGVLDFSDVVAFLTAFGSMDPAADLAPPVGVFDFSDVVAFLGSFGAGCP